MKKTIKKIIKKVLKESWVGTSAIYSEGIANKAEENFKKKYLENGLLYRVLSKVVSEMYDIALEETLKEENSGVTIIQGSGDSHITDAIKEMSDRL